MVTFTDEVMRRLLAENLRTASFDGTAWRNSGGGPGSDEAEFVSWLTIRDLAQSVREDVHRIQTHPLVAKDIPVYGYIYDVKTGRLQKV